MRVEILSPARSDLRDGRSFYEQLGGAYLGSYFFDTVFSEIDSLAIYAGLHPKRYGFYWTMTRHFPYSIYYDISNGVARVYAVIDNRRDPNWIYGHLQNARGFQPHETPPPR